MKKSTELKQERAQKVERMQAITSGAELAKRDLSPEETTEFDKLSGECDNLDQEIERSEKWEARQLQVAGDKPPKKDDFQRAKESYSIGKAIREYVFARGAAGLTGLEKEVQQEYERNVSTGGIILPISMRANENTMTSHTTIVESQLATDISIMGKEPIHKQMGITVMPNLKGTVKLPFKTPSVAQKVAIGTNLSNNSNNPDHVTLSPERYGDTDVWDLDLIKTQNDPLFKAIIADMLKGCDRAITADLYTVALAAATEVTSGAITESGLNLLFAKMGNDGNWGLAMDRESFWTGVGVAYTGSGSGKTLLEFAKPGQGRHATGVPAWFSELFADGAAKQYVLFGDWSQMVLGEWDGVEMIIDPYTLAPAGRVAITINKIADIVCRNAAAMWRTPDLDSAT